MSESKRYGVWVTIGNWGSRDTGLLGDAAVGTREEMEALAAKWAAETKPGPAEVTYEVLPYEPNRRTQTEAIEKLREFVRDAIEANRAINAHGATRGVPMLDALIIRASDYLKTQ